jgi:hypothetical protein
MQSRTMRMRAWKLIGKPGRFRSEWPVGRAAARGKRKHHHNPIDARTPDRLRAEDGGGLLHAAGHEVFTARLEGLQPPVGSDPSAHT